MHPAIDSLERAYADRLEAARRAQAQGRKVAGFVSSAVPIELIEAAGFHPVMISGAGRAHTPLADAWMESTFDPMARAIFEAALRGELQFLDILVVPRSADSFMRLYLYLREVERQRLCDQLPKHIVLYDLLQTAGPSRARHNLSQLHKLSDTLSSISGREVDASALGAAIEASNGGRRVLRALLERRRTDGGLSGSNVLKAIASRYWTTAREHEGLLRDWSDALPAPQALSKPPVLVAGNAQDNDALHRLLDECGLHVAGDRHWLGDPCAEEIAFVTGTDPFQALSEHYHLNLLSSRRFPQSPSDIVSQAKACGAAAAVFYLFDAEEALTWDCPNEVQALQDAGIATLVLEKQPYVAPVSLGSELRALAARLRSAS